MTQGIYTAQPYHFLSLPKWESNNCTLRISKCVRCIFFKTRNQKKISKSSFVLKPFFFYKVTYTIGHQNPSVRIIDLVFHTTYVVCVNFIHKRLFKVNSEPQNFWEAFHAILFILRVFAKILLRGNRRRNIFCILFSYQAWGSNPGFMSNKPSSYPLDYGNFFI